MNPSPVTSTRQARQATIDSFLDSLDPWDMIYIRQSLRKRPRPFMLGLHDMPVEIILLIFEFLHFLEIINCFQVCRSWRAVCTSTPITRTLFRHIQSDSYNSRNDYESFMQTYDNYKTRYWGPSAGGQKSVHWTLPSEAQNADAPQHIVFGERMVPTAYQDGKFAWQPERHYFMILDIASGKTQTCWMGNQLRNPSDSVYLQAISKDLLLLCTSPAQQNTSRDLYVWHLQLQKWSRIVLPSPFAKAYISGSSIAISTMSADVYLWSWGGILSQLSTEKVNILEIPEGHESCLGGVPGVLFHQNQNIIYLVWLYRTKAASFRIVVVKYIDQKATARFDEYIQNNRRVRGYDGHWIGEGIIGQLLCQPMNSQGGYSLAFLRKVLKPEDPRFQGAQISAKCILSFNTNSEQFTHSHMIPSDRILGSSSSNRYGSYYEPYRQTRGSHISLAIDSPHLKEKHFAAWDTILPLSEPPEQRIGPEFESVYALDPNLYPQEHLQTPESSPQQLVQNEPFATIDDFRNTFPRSSRRIRRIYIDDIGIIVAGSSGFTSYTFPMSGKSKRKPKYVRPFASDDEDSDSDGSTPRIDGPPAFRGLSTRTSTAIKQ